MALQALASIVCVLLCLGSAHAVVLASKPQQIHLKYYVYEIRGGPNSSILAAAGTGQGNLSATGWGSFEVYEDSIRADSTIGSPLLGIRTGTSVVTTKGGIATGGIQISSNDIFTEAASSYNGSSLTILGRVYGSTPYEFLVPGGTGYFLGYTGYVLAQTVVANPPLFVIQQDVYLFLSG